MARIGEFEAPFTSLPFDDSCVDAYGRIRSELEKAGTPIGPNDLMIAAVALTHNLTLVTHNTREFQRVAHLSLADWKRERLAVSVASVAQTAVFAVWGSYLG